MLPSLDSVFFRSLVFVGIALAIVATSILACSSAPSLEKVAAAEPLYTEYCASCHGAQGQSFVNRNWQNGKSKEAIYESIKLGRPNQGMPAFGATLTDEEIYALVDFVLNASTQTPAQATTLAYETVLQGIGSPWAIAELPNGDLLITERDGKLLHFSNGKKTYINNLPEMIELGQGGLMDLQLHPEYAQNGWVYIAYAKPDAQHKKIANTAVSRGKIVGDQWTADELIFEALPKTDRGQHFGGRMAFDQDGFLYVSVGDRGERDTNPQSLSNHNGKIHRLHDDGRIPADNPFVNTPNAVSSIWTYGHRNPQGLGVHPKTGQLWSHEHGPKGGDELNLIEKGKNYGWPVISYGINYNGTSFTDLTEKEGMEQPITYWVPSIAPCGMAFSNDKMAEKWQNSIFMGSLSFEYLERCELQGLSVIKKEKLLDGIGRVRTVTVSSNGYLLVGIEKPGRIIKLNPN